MSSYDELREQFKDIDLPDKILDYIANSLFVESGVNALISSKDNLDQHNIGSILDNIPQDNEKLINAVKSVLEIISKESKLSDL